MHKLPLWCNSIYYMNERILIKPLYTGTQIVWFIFSAIEAILLFRFLLKLIGANPSAPFTNFLYDISRPLISPFLGIVPSSYAGGGIIEWSTPIALLPSWLPTWGIVRLLLLAKPISTDEARTRLVRVRRDEDLD